MLKSMKTGGYFEVSLSKTEYKNWDCLNWFLNKLVMQKKYLSNLPNKNVLSVFVGSGLENGRMVD